MQQYMVYFRSNVTTRWANIQLKPPKTQYAYINCVAQVEITHAQISTMANLYEHRGYSMDE